MTSSVLRCLHVPRAHSQPMSLRDAEPVQHAEAQAHRHRPREPRHLHRHRLARGLLVVRADPPVPGVPRGGYEVELFSPSGGACVADGMSDPRDPSGYSAIGPHQQGFMSHAQPRGAGRAQTARERDRRGALRCHRGGRRPGADVHLRAGHRAAPEVRGVLRGRQGRLRAVSRRGAAALRPAVERRAAGQGQDRHRLRQRRRRLRRQRGVGPGRCCRATAT
jgi:hypothetical protein